MLAASSCENSAVVLRKLSFSDRETWFLARTTLLSRSLQHHGISLIACDKPIKPLQLLRLCCGHTQFLYLKRPLIVDYVPPGFCLRMIARDPAVRVHWGRQIIYLIPRG